MLLAAIFCVSCCRFEVFACMYSVAIEKEVAVRIAAISICVFGVTVISVVSNMLVVV